MNDKQVERVIYKLTRLQSVLDEMLYKRVGLLTAKKYLTKEKLNNIPQDNYFTPVSIGETWGGQKQYCWFKGVYTVPNDLKGQNLFIKPKFGGYEGLLWVNGEPFGNFARRITYTAHGNHYCKMVKADVKSGEKIDIAIEVYAGHDFIGKMPEETYTGESFLYSIGECEICVKNQDIYDFYFNLKTFTELYLNVDADSFTRGKLTNLLLEINNVILYSPSDCSYREFAEGICAANNLITQTLSKMPSGDNGEARIIGHSHIDTAWIWEIDETVKKCARTFSNQISMMEQYPEYIFTQSSSYHLELMRQNYPSLYSAIKQAIGVGRYEPNGGAWVECDCNITGGESLIRQFLWGQRFTKEQFGYLSNTFWLPDTFGYSAAIPQIMQGCGIKYFCTTKIEWNDTTQFPYDTFYWEGIDGSRVLAHFNKTNLCPSPEHVVMFVSAKNVRNISQKSVTDKRLLAFGYGDGGGGPEPDMLEMARRCKNLEGCPKVSYQTVGDFMEELAATVVKPSVWVGELYLELHRGTLTSQHKIKRNNRKAEIALHNAELLTVFNAVKKGVKSSGEALKTFVSTILVNQFHDILPGTCIPEAHDKAYKDMDGVLCGLSELIADITKNENPEGDITLINTLSFERSDVLTVKDCIGLATKAKQQLTKDLDGETVLRVVGLKLPPFSSTTLKIKEVNNQNVNDKSAVFVYDGKTLETPFAKIVFAKNGTILSFYDKRAERELVNGLPFNTFVMCEDFPLTWDNWDLDADSEGKYKDVSKLISREVVSCGDVEFRIRSTYKISDKSSIRQDMIFYSESARVDFDTELSWNDAHRFLKTCFDTSVRSTFARQEIQFGHVLRTTNRNTDREQAMFETLNHKYSDLSETRFGISIINDCKYGISVFGGSMRLSLIKGGTHPDHRADNGVHRFSYSLSPHIGGFCAESVIQPAYEFNIAPMQIKGEYKMPSFINVKAPNVIAETIKPCEDSQNAYILRLYEAENSACKTQITLNHKVKKVAVTDMLENEQSTISTANEFELNFTPFEIKTIKIFYD